MGAGPLSLSDLWYTYLIWREDNLGFSDCMHWVNGVSLGVDLGYFGDRMRGRMGRGFL